MFFGSPDFFSLAKINKVMIFMKLFIYLIGIIFVVYVFDKFCLWLEQKGCLYYRHKKPQKGIIGTALQELNAQLLPSHRHVLVAKEQKVQKKCKLKMHCSG